MAPNVFLPLSIQCLSLAQRLCCPVDIFAYAEGALLSFARVPYVVQGLRPSCICLFLQLILRINFRSWGSFVDPWDLSPRSELCGKVVSAGIGSIHGQIV